MVKEPDLIKILSRKNQENHGSIFIHRMGDNRLMIRKNTHGSKPIIINRHIPVCNLLFEGLGLWSGDGWKKEVLGFTNSEVKLIRHFIKFYNLLGIQRNALNWDLQLIIGPDKIDEIIKTYSKKIGLKKVQFRSYIVQKRNYNCIRVYKHSRVLPILINAIFNYSLSFITKDIQFGASYLKGVFATDGWVTLRKRLNTIKHVGVAVQSPQFKKIFIRAFACLGINPQTNDKGIYISSHEDFIKLERLGLLELRPKKKKKFRSGLKRFCSEYGKNKYKTLPLLTSHNKLSAYELANLIQITSRTARRIFQQLQRENYVRYKEKSNRHVYLITKKGKNLFKEDKDAVLLRLAYLRHKI